MEKDINIINLWEFYGKVRYVNNMIIEVNKKIVLNLLIELLT